MGSIEITILTSLKICFAYGSMKEGNIFFFMQRFFAWLLKPLPIKTQLYLARPLWQCLFCMSSVYGIIFTYKYFEFSIEYLFLILQIAGLNYLISTIIRWYHDMEEKNEPYHEERLEEEKEAAK